MFELPGYEIKEKIYESQRTLVYRAVRESDNLRVILKSLSSGQPSLGSITRLNHEAQILKKLDYEGVPKFIRLFSHQNVPVLVEEDIEGTSLDILFEKRAMKIRDFLVLAIDITGKLGVIHEENIIHKDINPSNLVMNTDQKRVQFIDFGIGSLLSKETPFYRSPERLEGTLAYISPEQTGRMNQEIDYRTDFYSLGATFFELLTGRKPCSAGDPLELVHCHIAKPLESLKSLRPDIPEVLEAVIQKLLSKAKEERYQSAYGLKTDLENCLDQLNSHGRIEPFELGGSDFSRQFRIPQKLYGREQEVEKLMSTFATVSEGAGELLLIAGYSGIGKTVLVNEVQKPIVGSRGHFVSGKFDQFKRDIPFSAFIQAFQDLIQQMLTQSEQRLTMWKNKILEALAPNAQVIIDVIPELELVTGKQPEVPQLAPTEAHNRFNTYFRLFVNVFAAKAHPLVIFLDDLQWADNASLDLIKTLVTDWRSEYLLVIGAYRDNEVDPAHPLILTVEDCRNLKARVETIELKPLAPGVVNRLIADSVHRPPEKTEKLSELIVGKTAGNPFFTKAFLTNLYKENQIRFKVDRGTWEWDINRIRQVDLADNVVELMIRKIGLLPEETRNVLKLAACIGNRFDLYTLSIAHRKNADRTARALWKALEEGLIIPVSENYNFTGDANTPGHGFDTPEIIYKFQHDRVQQAASDLLSEDEKRGIHLRIGRSKMTRLEVAAGDIHSEAGKHLVEVANHINHGRALIRDPDERKAAARINFLAGKRAKGATAYESAKAYFKEGAAFTGDDLWNDTYPLGYKLLREQIECEYLTGDHERADNRLEALTARVRERDEKVELLLLRTTYSAMVGNFAGALDTGINALRLLDVELPLHPDEALLQAEGVELQDGMAGRSISDLVNLPEINDPHQLLCLRVLSQMWSPAYVTGNASLLATIILKMTNIAVRHGDLEGTALSTYGMLQAARQNYKEGYDYALVATKLAPNTLTHFLFGSVIGPWQIHLKECIPFLENAYRHALANGELTYGRYICYYLVGHALYKGDRLQAVREINEKYARFVDESDPMMMMLSNIHRLIVDGLTTTPDPFDNSVFDENGDAEQTNPHGHNIYYINKALVSIVMGNYRTAVDAANIAERTLGATIGNVAHMSRICYICLGTTALMDTMSGEEQQRARALLDQYEPQLKLWADAGPSNFSHKYLLVKAEISRVKGDAETAMACYEKAIKKARENQYIQDLAIANEFAARFYRARGAHSLARHLLEEAHYWFLRWGAEVKVRQLEEKYPHWLGADIELKSSRESSLSTHPPVSSRMEGLGGLDLGTVMKSNQAISREIVLEKLLETLMSLLIENAGAQKGYLVLVKDGNLYIEAQGHVEGGKSIAMQSVPVDLSMDQENPMVPVSVLSFVYRTQKEVVLKHAANAGRFAQGPYIRKHKPKSVLCVPILHHRELLGMIYLENELVEGAFTAQRLEMVRLLAGQSAISIENAQLYQNLEQKVSDRTHELQEALENLKNTQRQLIESEKMAALGSMVAGVAHELNTPMGICVTGASFLKDKTADMERSVSEQTLTKDGLKKYLRNSKEVTRTLLKNLERSADLVRSFKQTAVDEHAGEVRTFDVVEHMKTRIQGLNPRIKQARLRIEFNSNVAELRIRNYPEILSQVIAKLLDNSIMHGFEGKKNSGVVNLEVNDSPGGCTIIYSDNGAGIEKRHLDKIFTPFFTTKRNAGGTGLGLSIVFNLVTHKMEGEINCNSEAGRRTTFTIKLPSDLRTE